MPGVTPQVSWCKLELEVASPKNVTYLPDQSRPAPALVVAAINLKTLLNERGGRRVRGAPGARQHGRAHDAGGVEQLA